MIKNKKILKAIVFFLLVILIYACTTASFHLLNEGVLRTIILFLNSYIYACFVSAAYVALIIFIIYIIFFISRPRTRNNALLIFNKLSKLFFPIVLCLSLLITIVGWIRIENIKVKRYDIDIEKINTDKNIKYLVMSDIHMGSGTGKKSLKKISDIVKNENPDAILLVGDIFDNTTSKKDIDNFYDTFSTFICPIICLDGNHEDECCFNYETTYDKLKCIKVNDSSYTTKENIQLIGLSDDGANYFDDILSKENIDTKKPIIVLKHRPTKYRYIKDTTDIVLSGHVHGPRFPLQKLYYSFLMDSVYGMKKIDNMISIVTSGVSAWGEHLKISSDSEVVVLKIE